jgi:hypothetical protein
MASTKDIEKATEKGEKDAQRDKDKGELQKWGDAFIGVAGLNIPDTAGMSEKEKEAYSKEIKKK